MDSTIIALRAPETIATQQNVTFLTLASVVAIKHLANDPRITESKQHVVLLIIVRLIKCFQQIGLLQRPPRAFNRIANNLRLVLGRLGEILAAILAAGVRSCSS